MSDRRQEFRVGVVALAAAMTMTLLVGLNTGSTLRLGSRPYELLIEVDRAPGVGPNTPVHKDGVLIGRVTGTEFLERGGVLVRANILPDAPVYRGDSCRIQPSSLFGDAVINFAFTGEPGDAVQLEPGTRVMGEALPDPIEALTTLEVNLAPAIESIGEAADGIAQLSTRLNEALGEDFDTGRVHNLLDEGSSAFAQFEETMNSISEIVDDPELRKSIDQAIADLPLLLADARSTVQKAEGTLSSFDSVVVSAEENLTNLKGFTKPLGDRGPELAEQILGAIDALNLALENLSEFTTALNSSDGTLSRLVNDPTLYENVSTVVANANSVLVRINDTIKDLRPIIYDVRVFTDKIAREPGRIVGGALNKGPGLK